MSSPTYDYQFKVIVIGDSMVGKSTLVNSFVENKFVDSCEPTIGVDFCIKNVRLPCNKTIKLQIWDTAGQEKFRSISQNYYRNTVAAILVFDLTKRSTFDNIVEWYSQAAGSIICRRPVFVLVGTKKDIADKREVSSDEARALAEDLGNFLYFETSAKLSGELNEYFICISQRVFDNMNQGAFNEESSRNEWDGVVKGQTMQSRYTNQQNDSSSGCC